MTPEMDENEPLSHEDIGHLLDAKADKLITGDGDPEQVIREVLETLSRSDRMRSRTKTVDTTGRVSVGRDLTGVRGMLLFQPDPGDGDTPGEVSDD
jgi:hypothetical protein